MMNLSLLFWASRQTKDPRFAKVATIHADTCAREFIRENGSVSHIIEFDPETGVRVQEHAGQGYCLGSSWSRGQAWGLYGFTLAHLNTHEPRYLAAAEKIAGYFMAHIRPDGLTDCDFCQAAGGGSAWTTLPALWLPVACWNWPSSPAIKPIMRPRCGWWMAADPLLRLVRRPPGPADPLHRQLPRRRRGPAHQHHLRGTISWVEALAKLSGRTPCSGCKRRPGTVPGSGAFFHKTCTWGGKHDTLLSRVRAMLKTKGRASMKIDRLIGILALLLQQERVTAASAGPNLRGIPAHHPAGRGSPVPGGYSPGDHPRGRAAGISIMEGYRIDSTLLTSGDMQAILAGLRSLDSVSGTNRYAQLMEKLSPGASTLMPGSQNLLIDLSSWYRDSLAPKIERIRQAMDTSREIAFCYYAPGGNSRRTGGALLPGFPLVQLVWCGGTAPCAKTTASSSSTA